MENIYQLIYILQTLKHYCKNAHWNAHGALFEGLHELYEEFQEMVDGEIDDLVELSIGRGANPDFIETKHLLTEVINLLPEGNLNNIKTVEAILGLEEKVEVKILEIKQSEVGVGLYNKVAGISEAHGKALYKIRQILKH